MVTKKEQHELAKAPKVGRKKSAAVIKRMSDHMARLKRGDEAVDKLGDYLEAGGYKRPSVPMLRKLAVEIGVVVYTYGRTRGVMLPEDHVKQADIKHALETLTVEQRAILMKMVTSMTPK